MILISYYKVRSVNSLKLRNFKSKFGSLKHRAVRQTSLKVANHSIDHFSTLVCIFPSKLSYDEVSGCFELTLDQVHGRAVTPVVPDDDGVLEHSLVLAGGLEIVIVSDEVEAFDISHKKFVG